MGMAKVWAIKSTNWLIPRSAVAKIWVTCSQSYFISELLYAPAANLQRQKASRLTVFSLGHLIDQPNAANAGPTPTILEDKTGPDAALKGQGPHLLEGQERVEAEARAQPAPRPEGDGAAAAASSASSRQLIGDLSRRLQRGASGDADTPCRFALDIDLDFYSTKNPFLQEVGEEILDVLKELYYFKMPPVAHQEEITKVMSERQIQLSELEAQLRRTVLTDDPLEDVRYVRLRKAVEEFLLKEEDEDQREADEGDREEDTDEAQQSTSKYLRTKVRDDLPAYLHEVGCTCDETPLPHHVSSQRQIDHLVEETRKFLLTLPNPSVVTLARSSLDEYCPKEQVDGIQANVIQMLESIYGSLNVTLDY